MPTYEYVCEKCDHEFEVVQSMRDARLEDCPLEGCGGKVRRKIGRGAGLIFKGSGFYSTDYRSPGYKSDAKKDSADSGVVSGKAKESKSGESKSAKSSDSAPAKST